MSLSFPASSHVVALGVHILTDLPWLADFSDPWMDNPYAARDEGNVSSIPGRFLERRVLQRAACVGFANQELAEFVARRYPSIREKSVELRNACEQADFRGLPAFRASKRRFTLVHVGSLYGLRQPTSLLGGLARFLRAHPDAPATLRLVGTWKFDTRPPVLDDPVLRDRVEVVPMVNRRQALEEMRSADLLVVVDPSPLEPSIFFPLKVAEYLMSGRPVLALTVSGPTERLIRKHGAGTVVRFDDEVAVADQIFRFYASRTVTVPPLRDVPELEAASVGRDVAAALDRIAR